MKNHEIKMAWQGDMAFEGLINGHKVRVDADESVGGNDSGPRPKPFVLVALAGCTGMDVTMILKKMRVVIEDLNISVNGTLSEEQPAQYTSMHVTYEFKGENLNLDKLTKAVELSQNQYCGVSAMYKKAIPLTYEIKII
ncbi:MAG: OsmC family protein [Salinivirgaceae bacterium]|nr:OsmC family protein [Salinivirgaceae bacterium]